MLDVGCGPANHSVSSFVGLHGRPQRKARRYVAAYGKRGFVTGDAAKPARRPSELRSDKCFKLCSSSYDDESCFPVTSLKGCSGRRKDVTIDNVWLPQHV